MRQNLKIKHFYNVILDFVFFYINRELRKILIFRQKYLWNTIYCGNGGRYEKNIINIFQPDILCIGGGISNQGENLLAPLRTIVEKERYTKHNDKQTVICKASLGNDAGIIGAAFLE